MEKMPVLNRPMFNAPSPSMGGGISTVPRPEIEAQNLRTLFGPAQPVQSFQEGGMAQQFSEEELARIQDREARRRFDIDDTESRTIAAGRPSPPIPPSYSDPMGSYTGVPGGEMPPPSNEPSNFGGSFLRAITGAPVFKAPPTVAPGPSISPADVARMRDRDIAEEAPNYAARQAQAAQALSQRAPPPAAAAAPTSEPVKPKGELELSLEAIRSRRAEDRKENALLALMQAGFAAAGGRSSSALTNIAAGGQAGIAAFAGMEKGSREDQRAAMQDLAMRRREISSEKLARDLATQKMQEDPDSIKLYKALGGGDLQKGFALVNADAQLKAAQDTAKNMFAPEESRINAQKYSDVRIRQALSGGGGNFPGFSGAPVR